MLLFWIYAFLMEQMLFKAFKSLPLKILCCHLAINPVIKISPEHLPGRSLVTYMRVFGFEQKTPPSRDGFLNP